MKPVFFPPYIGVTGFRSPDEVAAIRKRLPRQVKRRDGVCFHVGVMMSRSTMLGLPSKFTGAFPQNEDVAAIFDAGTDAGAYCCLHYAERGLTPPREFEQELYRALSFGGPYVDAVQLDVPWPDPAAVANAVHMTRKPLEVILQIGRNAWVTTGNPDPEKSVLSRLADYGQVVHRVLLDLSMGEGIPLEPAKIAPMARAIRGRYPDYGLVFAGGLGPDTLGLVEELMLEFPDASLDAQARLCQGGDAKNPLDLDACAEYVSRALEFYSRR